MSQSRGKVKFYLPDNARILTSEDEVARAHAGPDWVCLHCGAAVPATETICPECRAERGTSPSRPVIEYGVGEAPSASEQADGEVNLVPATKDVRIDWNAESGTDQADQDDDSPKWENDWEDRPGISVPSLPFSGQQAWGLAIFLVISLIVGGLYMFLHTKKVRATVDHFEWSRTISIEEYRTIREGDWSIPAGGRYVSQEERYHHTETYQCGTELQDEEYICGSHEESCGMTDNGNGTFSECTRTVSDYCTRQVSVPKYCDRDIYATWYTYDIDRWTHSRSVSTSGNQRDDPAPYWGEFTLNCANQAVIGCERESGREQTYYVFFRDEEGKIKKYEENSQDDWNQYQIGASYTLRINHFGQIRNDPLHPDD